MLAHHGVLGMVLDPSGHRRVCASVLGLLGGRGGSQRVLLGAGGRHREGRRTCGARAMGVC